MSSPHTPCAVTFIQPLLEIRGARHRRRREIEEAYLAHQARFGATGAATGRPLGA